MFEHAGTIRRSGREMHERRQRLRVEQSVRSWLMRAPEDGHYLSVPIEPFIDFLSEAQYDQPPCVEITIRHFRLEKWRTPGGVTVWAAVEKGEEKPFMFGPRVPGYPILPQEWDRHS